MNKITHRIKIFFLRVKWYFDRLYFAQKHFEQVKNYSFLVSTREKAYSNLLVLQREKPGSEEVLVAHTQVKLLDKIIGYVNSR